MRRLVVMALCAGLLSVDLVYAAEPPPTTPGSHRAAAPDTLTIALLYSDRAPVLLAPASPGALQPAQLRNLSAAWVWSDHLPPRRLRGEDLRRELTRLQAADRDGRAETLSLHLPPGVDAPQEDLSVLAAPVAMFREVPEEWLPRWPLSAEGVAVVPRRPGVPWRLRLVGDGRGSVWRDVSGRQSSGLLVPLPAGAVHTMIADAAGDPLPGGSLTVLEGLHGSSRPEVLCQTRADERGVLRIPALPADVALSFVASAPGRASRTLMGRPTDLPAALRLPDAAILRGRFVDGDGRAIAGVKVRAEGWLADDLPVLFARRGESDDSGGWEIAGVPPRRLALLASREGYAPLARTLEPSAGEGLDLGELVLLPGADLAVVLRDDAGESVPGALVRTGSGKAVTDGEGRVLLEDLPAGGDLELRAKADGFLDAVHEVRWPWPAETAVTLTRAFTVRGVFLGQDGLPVTAGGVRIEQGSTFSFEELAADGRFTLHLESGAAYTLRLSSPTTASLAVEVAPGSPGEQRDLGELVPPPGVMVRGTVLSAVDGVPVAGARIWTPRPSPDPVGAWFHGDLLETRSDELGRFVLGGLVAKPEVLRIEAGGFARRQVTVQPEAGVPEVDLGEVELNRGARLRVWLAHAAQEAAEGATARLDLRQRWLDLDMLTATVVDGTAELPHVPAGEALLTVLAGRELLCERTVEVEAGDEQIDVECGDDGHRVSGLVLAAARAAGPGTLEWSSDTGPEVKATILNRDSRLGLRQQRVVGAGRPPVQVEVAADGTFTTDRLRPGRWNVTWWPTHGSPAAPQRVEVPEGPAPNVVVRIAGGVVSGRVRDESGAPVDGVWVRQVNGGGLGRTDADGSFRIAGLAPGRVRLQAREGERFSDVGEVWLEPDRTPEAVELTLSDDHAGRLTARVWTDGEVPAAGAFVFFDLGRRGVQVMSADGEGRVELVVAAPYPRQARLAAFHAGRWVFGEWTPWARLRDGAELEIPAAGELQVESDERRGPVTVRTAGGWDLSQLLGLLGSSPSVSPRQPLLLSGLPEGVYRVGEHRSVSVRADRRQRIELE